MSNKLKCPFCGKEIELRWIPVSEKLPENGEEVLISYDGDVYLTTYEADAYYFDNDGNMVDCQGFRMEANDYVFADGRDFPSYWMPLPKPIDTIEEN